MPLGKVQVETANEFITMRLSAGDQDANVTFKVSDKKKVHKIDGTMKFENRVIKHFEMTAV